MLDSIEVGKKYVDESGELIEIRWRTLSNWYIGDNNVTYFWDGQAHGHPNLIKEYENCCDAHKFADIVVDIDKQMKEQRDGVQNSGVVPTSGGDSLLGS